MRKLKVPESMTKTIENGTFKRVKIRRGKKTKQKTIFRKGNNPEKVILGYFEGHEIFVYPYRYPKTVFVGTYPKAIPITNSSSSLRLFNLVSWYISGKWRKTPLKPNKRDSGARIHRQHIVSAIKYGVETDKSIKEGRFIGEALLSDNNQTEKQERS
jgi:hypothetical protein